MTPLKHFYEVQQLSHEDLEQLFRLADRLRELGRREPYTTALAGQIVHVFFYEESTRTRLSFETAVKRLGGQTVTTTNARQFSSVAKGETLRDTMRVISNYADAIILRSDRTGGAEEAAGYASVPVVNAGDGSGQHPTQALLDMYTVIERFGVPRRKTFVLVGDLLHGRTVHSLAYLLAKHYPDNRQVYLSPALVRMPENVCEYVTGKGIVYRERDHWDNALEEADVIYMTRVQDERYKGDPDLHKKVLEAARELDLTPARLTKMKPEAIILHPLPRKGEIPVEVDEDPRAWYFRQAGNGVYIRMALLLMLLRPDLAQA